MSGFLLIITFLAGLLLLFALGRAVGYLFKLDDYLTGGKEKHCKRFARH